MWLNILVFNKCLEDIKNFQKQEGSYSAVRPQDVTNNPDLVTRDQINSFNTTLNKNISELHKDKEIPMTKDEKLNEPISEQKVVISIPGQEDLHFGSDLENPTKKNLVSQKCIPITYIHLM